MRERARKRSNSRIWIIHCVKICVREKSSLDYIAWYPKYSSNTMMLMMNSYNVHKKSFAEWENRAKADERKGINNNIHII